MIPTATAPLHVALLGYGFAGRTFHAPLIGAVPTLRLAYVASSDAARVHADLPDAVVLADPIEAATHAGVDLVVVATPNASHYRLADAALSAGKHVVVDKPLTPTLDEARALAASAQRAGRILSVFHNRRWDSDFLAVRAAIDAGHVGTVRYLESRIERHRPQVRDRWRERPGPASGLWWDLGPHLVDQALLLMGRPDTVQASFARQREGALSDDWAHVVLAFGEARAVLHAGMLGAAPGARFRVHGTRGSLVKALPDPQERQLIDGLRPGDADWGLDADPLRCHGEDGVMRLHEAIRGDQSRFYTQLVDAIAGAAPVPVPVGDALQVMAVLEAAQRSADEGRVVRLPSVP
ncbi:oxidoreductase [Lysobacter humi (ex Lee et al. 2017)]